MLSYISFFLKRLFMLFERTCTAAPSQLVSNQQNRIKTTLILVIRNFPLRKLTIEKDVTLITLQVYFYTRAKHCSRLIVLSSNRKVSSSQLRWFFNETDVQGGSKSLRPFSPMQHFGKINYICAWLYRCGMVKESFRLNWGLENLILLLVEILSMSISEHHPAWFRFSYPTAVTRFAMNGTDVGR